MNIDFEAHQRLCYYPSCHYRTPWILLGLDCDLFIMSEKERRNCRWQDFQACFERHGHAVTLLADTDQYLHFRAGGRPFWVFREDNRQTLGRIADARLKIHHFVGIRDGCMEGGNHECVNERPFLTQLLPLAADGMQYTTDHMPPLQLSWERRRKFRSGCWRDFCLAEPSRSSPHSLTNDCFIPDDMRFDLQGVLVKDGDRLYELRAGMHPTALDAMRPFRASNGIGILAEYRLHRPHPEFDGRDVGAWAGGHAT